MSESRRTRAGIRIASSLLAGVLLFAPASAQVRLPGTDAGSSSKEEAAPVSPETLAEERARLAEAVEALRATANGGEAGTAARERLALLERLDRTLAAHQESLERLAEQSRPDLSGTNLLGGEPPYPFALYEATSQALDIHRRQLRLLEGQAKSRRDEIERLATQVEIAERDRRRAKERVETEADVLARAEWTETLRRLEIESRLAQAELARVRTEAALEGSELEAQREQADLLEATLSQIRSRLAVTRFDLDEPLNRITLREEKAKEQSERARTQLAAAEQRLAALQERIDGLTALPEPLRAELEARRAQRRLAETRIAVAESRLEQLSLERTIWERRVQALRGASREEVTAWAGEADRELDRMRRIERLEATHRDALDQEFGRLRANLETADAASLPWVREELQAVESMRGEHDTAVGDAAASRAFLQRTIADFRPEERDLDAGARMRSLATRARDLWDRELFVVDDRSITLGKVAIASILFILGISASRLISRLIWRLIYRRAFEPGAALAFQSLTFYALLVAFFLIALRTVNIPLTAFALLGGALAIGLGFGSQNVIGNFIGGLILLVERPIKVGDIVEVDGVTGIIDRVGPRSTQIRTFDNLHIIVPNSLLLEQKVVNWNLTDDTVRRQVMVGVAYDAPVREVTKLIRRAIDEHGRILNQPEPRILFHDFGDSALVFRALFWLKIETNVSMIEIESDLRHRIFNLFNEAGITISFPQRDVHLDATGPIEVRMLPPDAPQESGGKAGEER